MLKQRFGRAQPLLCEMPAGLSLEGDSGAIGRVVAREGGQEAAQRRLQQQQQEEFESDDGEMEGAAEEGEAPSGTASFQLDLKGGGELVQVCWELHWLVWIACVQTGPTMPRHAGPG